MSAHQVVLQATGPGLNGGSTAEPAHFTITASDASGRAAQLPADPLQVAILGPNGRQVQTQVSDNRDGSWNVSYQPQFEGHHEVTISLKSSIRVGIAVGTDASKSKAYGPGLEDGVQDNLPTHFTVEARGTDGNRMPKGGDPFEVKVTGPKGNVPAKITDNGDGTYNVDYAPNDAGPHRIDVTLKDKPVDRSPYTVSVREGADHNTSLIEGFQFVIRARTKNNKDMNRGGENFAVQINGPSGSVSHKLQDLRNGQYQVNYSLPPNERGTFAFSVQVNGKDIQGSPFSHSV